MTTGTIDWLQSGVQRSSHPKPKTVKAIGRRRRRTYFAVQKEDSTDDRPSGSSSRRSGKTWKTHDSWVSRLKRKELVLLQKTDAMGKQKGYKRECVPSTHQEQVATIPTRPYPSDRNFRGQMRYKHKPAVSGCPVKARTKNLPALRMSGWAFSPYKQNSKDRVGAADEERQHCLVHALRSLGVNVSVASPGPFSALHDGNQMLKHHGFSLSHVPSIEFGRYIVWKRVECGGGHFVGLCVSPDGVTLHDNGHSTGHASVASALGSGELMFYKLRRTTTSPSGLTPQELSTLERNRQSAIRLKRLKNCRTVRVDHLVSIYTNRKQALDRKAFDCFFA